MTAIENDVLNVLEKAFVVDDLWKYALDIQDYFADETDQLEIDNPEMDDYLQDVIPEFTDSFDNTKKKQWLHELRKIIDYAKTFIKD
ncbi:hypothetical protein [Weissella bombi]|uniref:hypothetical protein n=1 Tax=Weissella bombi TaxID=1505725 RepID=UPI003AF2925D